MNAFVAAYVAVLVISVSGVAYAAPANNDTCLTQLADVAAPPAFEDFPAKPDAHLPKARLQLNSSPSRMFRTRLRDGLASGPNFAGHFAVVVWGCGSSCSDLALVDTQSGQVYFDRRVRDINGEFVGDEPDSGQFPYGAVRYRLNSRLLVIIGAPNENDADGVRYFVLKGSRLHLLRFVPRLKACTNQSPNG